MMLAYGHSLSYDHQGFMPFSPDHREAAGPVGPAVSRVQVHCNLQTVTSCDLATASTAVIGLVDFGTVLLLGIVEVGQAAYMGIFWRPGEVRGSIGRSWGDRRLRD